MPPLDLETQAFAALAAAALSNADKPARRQLWRSLRAAVGEVHGSSWRPGEPWAHLLAALGQHAPRRKATRLGLTKGGEINKTHGHTVPETLPWAWAQHGGDDAA